MIWNLFYATLNRMLAIALNLVARGGLNQVRFPHDTVCTDDSEVTSWYIALRNPTFGLPYEEMVIAYGQAAIATAGTAEWLRRLGWTPRAVTNFTHRTPGQLRGAWRDRHGTYHVVI